MSRQQRDAEAAYSGYGSMTRIVPTAYSTESEWRWSGTGISLKARSSRTTQETTHTKLVPGRYLFGYLTATVLTFNKYHLPQLYTPAKKLAFLTNVCLPAFATSNTQHTCSKFSHSTLPAPGTVSSSLCTRCSGALIPAPYPNIHPINPFGTHLPTTSYVKLPLPRHIVPLLILPTTASKTPSCNSLNEEPFVPRFAYFPMNHLLNHEGTVFGSSGSTDPSSDILLPLSRVNCCFVPAAVLKSKAPSLMCVTATPVPASSERRVCSHASRAEAARDSGALCGGCKHAVIDG